MSELLKLHHLRPAPGSNKAKIRKGRGEASKGKTAGRGTKGTKLGARCRPVSRVARCPHPPDSEAQGLQ